MFSQHKFISILIGFSLLIPAALVARQANAQTSLQTVTDDSGANREITLKDTYRKSFDFTASLEQIANQQWKYSIKGSLPNPCYGFSVQYVEPTGQLIGWVNTPSGDKACTGVVQEVSESGVIQTPRNPDFKFRVEENELEKPTEGPESVPAGTNTETTAQQTEGSTGPTSGTTEQPTESNIDTTGQGSKDTEVGSTQPESGSTNPSQGNAGPQQDSTDNPTTNQADNTEVQAALDWVRTQLQMLVGQVFSTNN